MKKKKLMTYILIFLAFIAITFLIGRINLSIKFNKQVKQLFAESKNCSDKRYYKNQLDSLPEPVQRYFRHVLKEGQRYIDKKRLETWVIKHDTFEEKNGAIIPVLAEVFWRLKDGDFSYAKFIITEVEYNVAEKFYLLDNVTDNKCTSHKYA